MLFKGGKKGGFLCHGMVILPWFKFSGFSVFLGNLNQNKDFDELKSAISKFFSKEGLEIQDVRLGGTK